MTAQRNIGLTSLTTADRRWIEGMMRRLLAELLPTDDEMLTTEKVRDNREQARMGDQAQARARSGEA